jgi:hypothetical protein
MNQLTTVITAVYVLMHGIFGCCGDLSAHAGSHLCKAGAAHEGADPFHHHGTAESPSHSHDSEPAAPHECRHDSCQWLNARTVCADELFHAEWDQPTLLSVVASDFFSPTPASAAFPIDPPDLQAVSSMRLHLALSVLLI